MKQKRAPLITIEVPRAQHLAFREVAEPRTKDFVERFLAGQRFPGSLHLEGITALDLACDVYLQGLWDGVELARLRPELLDDLK